MRSMIVVAAVAALTASRPDPTELRIPAFTAYLAPDPDAAEVATDRPVEPFAARGTSLTWYGKFTTRGSVTVGVALHLAAGSTLPLRLTVGRSHRDVVATGAAGEVRIPFGAFAIRDTGYVAFALTTPSGDPAPGAGVSALLVDGAPATTAHFNLDARRNAASVHLRFPVDSGLQVTGFYSEVTAIDDPVATYYMACGFARGYFGMQVNSPTERRIIFSVWDAAAGTNATDRSTVSADNYTQLVAKGPDVVASVFGNEGTGGHSHLVYPWRTGTTQRFYVTAKPDGTFTVYTGYWFNPDHQAWQLLASFRAPKDGQGLRRLYSFSEDFDGANGNLRRKARYGNEWIRLADGSWRELTTATFTHDATGKADRLDRFMGVEHGEFFLSHGGFIPGYTQSGTAFTRPPTGRPPQITLPVP
jgi:hypothetical protein